MTRGIVETLAGAAVLIVATGFFAYAWSRADIGGAGGYPVHARFSNVGALNVGADVRIGGIRVGAVTNQELDPETYMAVVTMTVRDDIALTTDTTAAIKAEGLLGGAYVALEPGGEIDTIPPGGEILFAQAAPDMIDLMTQLVFSRPSAAGAGE